VVQALACDCRVVVQALACEVWQSNNTIHGEKVRGPFFNGSGQFAVHFTFDVTRKATGQRFTIEEVGLYTDQGDKITREQFFYDGEH
jgi:hypothetical protein